MVRDACRAGSRRRTGRGDILMHRLPTPHAGPLLIHTPSSHPADHDSDGTTGHRLRAPIAAGLSFVLPGAGQLYNRQHLLAALFVLPIAVLALAGLAVVMTARSAVLPWLFDIRFIAALLVLDLILFVWHAAAVVQAHRHQSHGHLTRGAGLITVVLVLLVVVMHAAPALYGLKLIETLAAVSLGGGVQGNEYGDGLLDIIHPPRAAPPPRSDAPEPTDADRTNILLVGIDSGPGRDHALTDTMLVVSLDPDGDPAMISIPRDLINAPLPNGEPYGAKLNSLLQSANRDVVAYPFGGAATLKATIGALLGVPVHYIAAVDIAGFRRVVDAIGGVEVIVEQAVHDPRSNLSLEPGPVWMDGALALRYVQSRYGAGDSDFTRAARQQQLLAAIRDKLTRTNLIAALPGLLDAVKHNVATDIPSARIPELARAVQDADIGRLQRVVIQPPLLVTPEITASGTYVLIPDLVLIRELGQELMEN